MIAAVLALALCQAPAAADPDLRSLHVEGLPNHLAVAALGPAGENRLVAFAGPVVKLVEEPAVRLRLAGDSVVWTVADLDRDGRDEVLVLVDGDALHRLERFDGRLRLSAPLAEGLGALPPRGVLAADFLRDFDGDGRLDLVLPAAERVRVFLGGDDGFRPGPDLGHVARLLMDLGRGDDLLDTVRRDYVLPPLAPRDLDGDGRLDLAVSDGLVIRRYLARGGELPEEPTEVLDLSRFRDEDVELDFGNLSRLARYLVVDQWLDLDADGVEDLLLLAGGKVRVFVAEGASIHLEKPTQTLKVRGNPFFATAARIDGDRYPDLVVVRVEDIGLGKLVKAAFFSWSIEFDFLVYRGKGGGRFSTRPMQDRSVVVRGDSLLAMVKEQRERLSALRNTVVRLCDTDGDGRRSDVAMLEPDGTFALWRGALGADEAVERLTQDFLRETLNARRDLDVDASALTDWVLGRTSALVAMTRERAPDLRLRLADDWQPPHAMTLRDLDGDGRDEAVVLRLVRPEPEDGQPPARPALDGYVVDLP